MYVQRMEPLKQSGPLSNLGSHGYYVFILVVITLKKDRDLKQDVSHLWSKFVDPSLNRQ